VYRDGELTTVRITTSFSDYNNDDLQLLEAKILFICQYLVQIYMTGIYYIIRQERSRRNREREVEGTTIENNRRRKSKNR
jgi:low temperature requirement protein LtrA